MSVILIDETPAEPVVQAGLFVLSLESGGDRHQFALTRNGLVRLMGACSRAYARTLAADAPKAPVVRLEGGRGRKRA